MKKSELLKIVKENQNVGDVLKVISDPKTLDTVNQTVDKLKSVTQQMQDMGLVDEMVTELLDLSKEYKNQTEFYCDMIDKFLFKIYGVSYFDTIPDSQSPALTQMSDGELQKVLRLVGFKENFELFYGLLKKAKHPDDYKKAYLRLLDFIREKNMNESLINDPIFNIIVEAEAPKISKAEILELINRKS